MDLQAHIDREFIARGGLREFVQLAWYQVEPSNQFICGWHVDAICEHLMAVTKGEITRLIINVPPGTSKSLLVSVFWPAWEWTFQPHIKWICASHDFKISIRDNRRARMLIDSNWYQQRWGHVFKPNPDEWRLTKFSNDKAGFRLAASVTSNILGEHADRQVCDDPIKAQDVTSTALVDVPACEKVWDWWSGTMATRLVPKPTSSRVIIMQRLHESDLSGRMLEAGSYEHLMLPMEFEQQRKCFTSLGFEDPRTIEGELLWPALYDSKAVELKKKELGERTYASQYQQRPSPAGGGLFKRDWMRQYWKQLPSKIHLIQSWDTTFKGGESSDYVVEQLWGYAKGNYYLVDQVRGKMDVPAQLAAIVAFSAKHRRAHLKLIEEAASGAGLVAMLKEKGLSGVVAEPVTRVKKEVRAASVIPLWEAGNVWLPHPDKAPWVHDFVEEMASFPMGHNDDQCDSMAQGLSRLRSGKATLYIQAMNKLSNTAGPRL